jgi:hypothetical protein
MPTDDWKNIWQEAMGAESSQTLQDLVESLSEVSQNVTSMASEISAQTGPSETLAQLGGVTGQPQSELVPVTGTADAGSSGSDGGGVLDQALSVIGGGLFSAFPLFSGIASLLGGDDAAPPSLEKYVPPPSIDYEGAIESSDPGVIYGVDDNAMGMPRLEGQVSDFPVVPAEPVDNKAAGNSGAGQAGMPAQPITIQVQAMDSQSFLDHSSDIAQAVKEAILNSNSLNDVLSGL